MKIRVRYASDVPELSENRPARLVNGVGDLPPAGNLRRRVQTRCADVADALRAHLGAFGDEEARGSALDVVGRGNRLPLIARLRVIGERTIRLRSSSSPNRYQEKRFSVPRTGRRAVSLTRNAVASAADMRPSSDDLRV